VVSRAGAVGALEAQLVSIRSVLCLGAHADDIEIGCGATILYLLGQNPALEVHWVVLSAAGEREREALDSAATWLAGSKSRPDIRVAGFGESYFPYESEVKRYLGELSVDLDPDLIFTHQGADLHQDHRVVSELTWQSFRDHLILEYEVPKWDGDLGRPNVLIPLQQSVCSQKIEQLMSAFPSQVGKDWFAPEVFWGLLRLRGMEARAPSGYAEAFYCRKLVLKWK
jgi:LmbE family N-acetylglucosaminyl deacetylase